MRGFVETRSLATTLTKRAREPSCSRNYSAGIGRGRGEGFGSYGQTEEPGLSESYGHGVPLSSAGRGGPLKAGFLDRRGPGAPNTGLGSQFGRGRGLGNPNQTDASEPLLPHRGSGEDPFAKPTKPTLNFGSAGFGRGKPVEKVSVPEDIFLSDRRSSLPSLSKWDEKRNTFGPKESVSPAESRLLEDESTRVLRFPAIPQQPRGSGNDGQMQGLQSSATATSFHAAPFQQRPPPSSHGGQPIQQSHVDAGVQPQPFSYMAPSTGWQQPIQQPHYDARLQMQPSMPYPPPPADWPQSPGIGETYQHTDTQAVSSKFEFEKSYEGRPEGSVEQLSYSAQEGMAQPYSDTTYVFNSETEQSQWASNIPESNQQSHATYAMSDWHSVSSTESFKPAYPSQNLPEPNQGQYLYSREAVQPPAVGSSSSDVSGYEYDWGQPSSESLQHSVEQSHVEAPMHVHKGLHYDGRIEECFKQGKLEDIDDIYNQMRAAGVQASAKTYGTLLQSYMQLGKMDKVSMIYQEMSGVLFSDKKAGNDQAKETPSTASQDSPTLHEFGGFSSSEEMSSTAQGAQHGAEFGENGGFAPLKTSSQKDSLTGSANADAEGFPPTGSSETFGKTGMGRGTKVGGFFNFDFPGGLGSGAGISFGKENMQVNQGSKSETHDDYSQTFTPVLQPGWYAFAPQGVSAGPGVGRGRPHSPQAGEVGIGSSMPSPSQQFDSGAGQGRSSYAQRMQAALQKSSPIYSRDAPAQLEHDYPEEVRQPWRSTEEAAERAMSILNTRFSRRYKNVRGWEGNDEDDAKVRRRSPVQLLRQDKPSSEKQKEPRKPGKVAKETHLTDEEAKKEAERLKAIEENESLQELYFTLDQFMKSYGEMALEPEHELGDFTNPDIEEKPFMPLEEYLEKAKPNILKTGLIRSEKEWKNMVSETLKHADYFEEFVERYSGPGRYTAKQENEDLEEIARALPSDVGRGAKTFVQKSLTTLKSNPGFNLDEKQWMLATMVEEFSQYAVQD